MRAHLLNTPTAPDSSYASKLCDAVVSEVHDLVVNLGASADGLHDSLIGCAPELERSLAAISRAGADCEAVLGEGLKLLRLQKHLVEAVRKTTSETKAMQAQVVELQQDLEQARRRAEEDPLTGLPNRAGLAERIKPLLQGRGPLCLAVIDLDKFKAINDTHGHHGGDRALEHFANLCRACLDPTDIVARWGGEEFLVVMPDVTLQGAIVAMDGLRRRLESTPAVLTDGTRVTATCSIGLTEKQGMAEGFEEIYARADRACYQAKEDGRNCLKVVRDAR